MRVGGGRFRNIMFILYSTTMARPLRIDFPGAVYHVTSRGNARADIFKDDADREPFLKILGQVVKRFISF